MTSQHQKAGPGHADSEGKPRRRNQETLPKLLLKPSSLIITKDVLIRVKLRDEGFSDSENISARVQV